MGTRADFYVGRGKQAEWLGSIAWPWDDSNTTDYAYAFDVGRTWGTRFGHGWWLADNEPDEDGGDPAPKDIEWPEIAKRNMTIGPRSGLIVIQAPKP